MFNLGFKTEGNEMDKWYEHINCEAHLTQGYMMGATAQEIKIQSSTTFVGHIGGPCLNNHGRVIGIRVLRSGDSICYLSPVSEFEVMLHHLETASI